MDLKLHETIQNDKVLLLIFMLCYWEKYYWDI